MSYDTKVCGTDKGFVQFISRPSADRLCITNKKMDFESENCEGVSLFATKSQFKGVSLLEYYTKIEMNKNNNDKQLITDNLTFVSDRYALNSIRTLLDNDQMFGASMHLGNISRDLYFSIVNSIKIQKKE